MRIGNILDYKISVYLQVCVFLLISSCAQAADIFDGTINQINYAKSSIAGYNLSPSITINQFELKQVLQEDYAWSSKRVDAPLRQLQIKIVEKEINEPKSEMESAIILLTEIIAKEIGQKLKEETIVLKKLVRDFKDELEIGLKINGLKKDRALSKGKKKIRSFEEEKLQSLRLKIGVQLRKILELKNRNYDIWVQKEQVRVSIEANVESRLSVILGGITTFTEVCWEIDEINKIGKNIILSAYSKALVQLEQLAKTLLDPETIEILIPYDGRATVTFVKGKVRKQVAKKELAHIKNAADLLKAVDTVESYKKMSIQVLEQSI